MYFIDAQHKGGDRSCSLMQSSRPICLYAFGSNGSGQLGIGHVEDTSIPQQCLFRTPDSSAIATDASKSTVDSFTDQQRPSRALNGDSSPFTVRRLVAGGNHTLLQTSAGIYAAGNNVDGRCAFDDEGCVTSPVFTLLTWTQSEAWDITHLAATWEASFFVRDATIVYACGSGSKGELGLGEGLTSSAKPSQIFDITQHVVGADRDGESDGDDKAVTILDILAGMNHVIVLLSTGELYGWGNCRKGQLGDNLKLAKIVSQPVRLQVPFRVRHVAAGRDFTFLVGSKGEQSLLGDAKHFLEPAKFYNLECGIPQSGWSCLYFLANKRLQSCGRNDRGQLHDDSVPLLKRIAAGSEHVLALTDDGALISWGWGEHGNCGMPIDDRGCVIGRYNQIQPKLSDYVSIIGVGAGCASSFFWTTELG